MMSNLSMLAADGHYTYIYPSGNVGRIMAHDALSLICHSVLTNIVDGQNVGIIKQPSVRWVALVVSQESGSPVARLRCRALRVGRILAVSG